MRFLLWSLDEVASTIPTRLPHLAPIVLNFEVVQKCGVTHVQESKLITVLFYRFMLCTHIRVYTRTYTYKTYFVSPQRKSLIATSVIVALSLFVVVVNYSQKPYFLLQPVFGQTFSSHWMFSKQPYKAFKPHLGYVSIPKQEVRDMNTQINTSGKINRLFFQ